MGSLIRRPRLAAALLVGAAAGSAVIGLSGCAAQAGHPAAAPASEPAYGGLPSYLPTSSLASDGVLSGSAARPALTVEGDAVKIALGHGGTVRATVSGPVVPGEGLPYQSNATTATFTVTLDDASAEVPLTLGQFHTMDHLGGISQLAPVPGEAGPPSAVEPGQTVTFELRAVMVTGEGILQWAPDGSHPVATWDFVVEND